MYLFHTNDIETIVPHFILYILYVIPIESHKNSNSRGQHFSSFFWYATKALLPLTRTQKYSQNRRVLVTNCPANLTSTQRPWMSWLKPQQKHQIAISAVIFKREPEDRYDSYCFFSVDCKTSFVNAMLISVVYCVLILDA